MKRIVILLLFIACAAAAVLWYLNSSPSLMQERNFKVKYGESMRMIAYNLKKNNLVKSGDFFVYSSYVLRRRYVRAGSYKIFAGMSTLDILRKLTRGEIITKKIIIPEGFNLYQMADRFEANGITDAGSFLNFAFNEAFLRSIGIESLSAEGYLFPDTYMFAEASDARDIIAAMHRTMKNVIGSAMTSEQKLSLHEMLTLASMIEKEAKMPEERELISSVFHNRLERSMKLDCDPTVRYAVKKFSGPITVSNLNFDSPYNTYKKAGLPPTPICSPGRGSIIAALRPKKTDYLYFVARNDGSHVFSKTLKEHNNAVRRWQR